MLRHFTHPANVYLFKVNKRNTGKRPDMFKVNNKDARKASLKSLWCLHY